MFIASPSLSSAHDLPSPPEHPSLPDHSLPKHPQTPLTQTPPTPHQIVAQGLEHAIAGTALFTIGPDDDEEELKDAVMEDMAVRCCLINVGVGVGCVWGGVKPEALCGSCGVHPHSFIHPPATHSTGHI